MIKEWWKKIKDTFYPYAIVLFYILMIMFLIIVASGCLALICTASTLNVVLGCCGLGIVITYIVMYVKRKFLNDKGEE